MVTRLLIATGNKGKIAEIRRVLDIPGLVVLTPGDLSLNLDVDETGTSYAENATLKAESFARAAGMLVLAEDSGLEVDALGGRPGVYSARYGGPRLSDADRNRLLLDELRDIAPGQRTARFRAVAAITGPGVPIQLFEGVVEGSVALDPRGTGGFGYDPIFLLPEGRTTAELDPADKDRVSHRGIAVRKGRAWLADLAHLNAD
jgi:XTP/dITP diphosphohydrolase